TRVGEISQVRLVDGSLATLDTDTVVRNWQVKGDRFVELVRGRARFQVLQDARHPFSVIANGRSVTALGTDFDVYLRRDSVRVTLIQGRLRVHAQDLPPIDMTAGYQLTAIDGGWALAQTDVAPSVSWTQRQLSFDDSTLHEVVDELNRYSSRKIVIKDPA